MSGIRLARADIAVAGWSCRFPGASGIDAFWSLLQDGRCSVGTVPAERWPLERYAHPARQKPGRSYTWAAGVLDDAWAFEPEAFGISPREAEQMDPQQRILLELTWEALEDAGIPPSSVAGSHVGVYIGGSSTDFANLRTADPAGGDLHFATGNALSILANRISYAFDFKGPSLTIDTACSSSLVALHHAVAALQSRHIDLAIVGGINFLASPFSFISFSQASMLSPTGRCRAFSDDADGYVRAEGGAVLVLRRSSGLEPWAGRCHGRIVATDVNSDGRTGGISLPSGEAQEQLLTAIYGRAGVKANEVAFVEAHGTGTPAGDPIEAGAIARAIARHRDSPLPIGSVKTNIGHTEPAAGLAGVVKALLALKHGLLPRSLHFREPNPRIPMASLNVRVAAEAVSIAGDARCVYAGVNSFGFGGTNAHAIVAASPELPGKRSEAVAAGPAMPPLLVSADSAEALRALAGRYAATVGGKSGEELARVASAAAHRREWHGRRLVVLPAKGPEAAAALRAAADGASHPLVVAGTAVRRARPVAFVFSGNGSQWVGMGRRALAASPAFRQAFAEVDKLFAPVAGWSLEQRIGAADLAETLPSTSVAQPLIFAVQVASSIALIRRGLRPAVVLGHSVGEVAAAHVSGALDLPTAVRVIHYRSLNQERAAGRGDMAVLLAPQATAEEIAAGIDGLELAAFNSPGATAVAGPLPALSRLHAVAQERGIRCIGLDLGYPFHSSLMAELREPLLADLAGMLPGDCSVPLVSTVTGAVIEGPQLGPAYWWRNVREPVRFAVAVREAAKLGARYFLEIGPRATLQRHVQDSLAERAEGCMVAAIFDRNEAAEPGVDPVEAAVARALANGAAVEADVVFGGDPVVAVPLPKRAWHHRQYPFAPSSEGVGYRVDPWHPLSGDRLVAGGLEWRSILDTTLRPELADHVVGGQAILPGSAFLEIALSVVQRWTGRDEATIADLEILKPLGLSAEDSRELLTRISPGSSTIEILSRPRLTDSAWLLHARAKLFSGQAVLRDVSCGPAQAGTSEVVEADALYRLARRCGLDYGPAFSLVRRVSIGAVAPAAHGAAGHLIDVILDDTAAAPGFLLDPMRIDACFHGLFALFPGLDVAERGVAYVPVRIDEAALLQPRRRPASARIMVHKTGSRAIVADFHVLDEDGRPIAQLRGARFVAVATRRVSALSDVGLIERLRPAQVDARGAAATQAVAEGIWREIVRPVEPRDGAVSSSSSALMVEGWAVATAYQIAKALSVAGRLDVAALVAAGRVERSASGWLDRLLGRLSQAGLCRRDDGGWVLVDEPELPAAPEVLASLVTDPDCPASVQLLAGELTTLASRITTCGAMASAQLPGLSHSARQLHATAGVETVQTACLVERALLRAIGTVPAGQPPRVLLLCAGHPSEAVRHAVDTAGGSLCHLDLSVVGGVEPAASSRTGSRHSAASLLAGSEDGSFDLVLAASSLTHPDGSDVLAEASRLLAPAGRLIALEPQASLFRMLVGIDAALDSAAGASAVAAPVSAGQWHAALARAGLSSSSVEVLDAGGLVLWAITASRSADSAARRDAAAADTLAATAEAGITVVAPDGAGLALAEALAGNLAAHGRGVLVRMDDALAGRAELAGTLAVVLQQDGVRDSADSLAACCLTLGALARRLDGRRSRLWLVVPDAAPESDGDTGGLAGPAGTGVWAFARTLTNEHPLLDVRRIRIAAGLTGAAAAERIGQVLRGDTAETEIHIEPTLLAAVRVEPLRPRAAAAAAARLERVGGSAARLAWRPIERLPPGPGCVEIAVEETGLNFRDLMWSMDLLPDDMLENGFTGAALGLECAGRVARVGVGVTAYTAGDRVVTMAPSAFSTHVVVAEPMLARIPRDMSFAAAASIPVAFLTAHYGLLELARLARGEWVLIHGAAGAVGLAAVQIAQAQGARIIATAGSPAKRAVLEALGVEHVLDSRSLAFEEEVRALTGEGVDVVLNSLAKEAMERSIRCLAPFGRFVELGKRDYVENTHVGLRPFRRNLSYFGVDVDQLMSGRSDVGHRVLAQVFEKVGSGTLSPLPHTVLPAERVRDAFQLMQHSVHLGKIVITPPDPATVAAVESRFAVAADRTHLVTGAFGGFGLETVRWLIERGARHLVLIGRGGAASPEAQAELARWRADGVEVAAEACDVADRAELAALLSRVRAAMPPLASVFHAAMVLDDGLIANLDAGQMRRVLRPKVQGADLLDELTRADPITDFVLYSSATTLFGNPGQAAYVTANAYLEGLARRRRRQGLPALAIGFGPISDVGVVARSAALQASLLQRRGFTGLRAAEALDLMGEAMARARHDAGLAVLTIAPITLADAARSLAVTRSPTYAALVGAEADAVVASASLDLRGLLATHEPAAARAKVAAVVRGRLAQVLRAREADLDAERPLEQIGLDSLMALEFGASLEKAFSEPIPIDATVGALSIHALTDRLIAQAGRTRAAPIKDAASAIVERHFVAAKAGEVEALRALVDKAGQPTQQRAKVS